MRIAAKAISSPKTAAIVVPGGYAPGNSPSLHPAANGMNTQREHERKKYRGDDSPDRAKAERHDGRASQGEQDGDGAGEGWTWIGFR